MSLLTWNRYGNRASALVEGVGVRLGQLAGALRHELVDLTLDVQLEGAFDAVYVDGDNAPCLATDTMKNTVYAFARQDPIDHVEAFALRLADHFAAKPAVDARPHRRRRASVGAGCRRAAGRIRTPSCRPAREHWTAVVTRDAERLRGRVGADQPGRAEDDRFGVRRISARRAHDAARHRRPHLATSITAAWTLPRAAPPDFSARERGPRARWSKRSPATTAARCSTRSTRWARRRWRPAADLTEITLTLPNRHHLLVDLSRSASTIRTRCSSPPTSRSALIEATIRR